MKGVGGIVIMRHLSCDRLAGEQQSDKESEVGSEPVLT